MADASCTYPVTRARRRGKCGAPARWTGKRFRCDHHWPRPRERAAANAYSKRGALQVALAKLAGGDS